MQAVEMAPWIRRWQSDREWVVCERGGEN